MRIDQLAQESPGTLQSLKNLLGINQLDTYVAMIQQQANRIMGQVPRAQVLVTAPVITPDLVSTDMVTVTAQTTALLIQQPTGVAVHGRRLLLTLQAPINQPLSFAPCYVGKASDLPMELLAGRTMYLGFLYEAPANSWSLLAYINNQP